MERVKPLDYNEYESLNNTKEYKNFNCKEYSYRCNCSFCLKNCKYRKRLTKTRYCGNDEQSFSMFPTKTSFSITSTTNNTKVPFKTSIRATTTSKTEGMTISLNDVMPAKSSTRKKLNKKKLSENEFKKKEKNLLFNIPNSTTEIITPNPTTAIATTPTTITKQSTLIHEYENIPPLKPKRKKHLTFLHVSGNDEKNKNNNNKKYNNNNKKKFNDKKKKRKNYKIPEIIATVDDTSNVIPLHTDKRTTYTIDGNGLVDSSKNNNSSGQHSYYDNTNEAIINNIKREHDIKLRLSQGCTSLMYACLQGDTGTAVQELRNKPEKVHRRDRKFKNVLHYCSSCKKTTDLVAAASVAVRAPELLESADEDGFTPLHLAVIQGNLAMVNLLLANKADVNAVDNEGHSVVHWATVCGEIEALRSVLQAGASVTKPDINGGSPLHYAAQMCGAHYEGKLNQATSSKLALEILAILLNHPQSSVDVTDKDGRQPLLWAASAGSAKAVIALVKAGARVESSDKDGLTALHCAASRGHTECIDTLISLCGAPTDLIDSNGCTALHYAVTLGHADATSRLLDLEADPNRQDRKGRTPAHCGCAKGQLETVKMLKERGANLWLRNAKGDLPLHEAASSGRRELVEWLLDQRPKQVNTTSNDGRTMLHIAANNDFTDMCKMLIDFGADVNCIYRNSKGVAMTPLDCSLQKGFRSTAKFLQSNSGLPASKLRLSGRHPNAFNEQELVKPLKYAEKEEVHDLKNQKKYIVYSKRSDSESSGCSCSEHWYKREHHVNHVCKHHRKRLRRRTSSCGEVDEIGNQDSCSDICRSKSNIEIRRKRSRERVYTSDEGDSCEVCCRHKRRLKSKRKERSQQRRYKEITYSEDDDDADRIRNQKRIEREKGKYSTKTDSKGNIYNESTVAKSESVEDAVDRSSPPLEKTQRPQSAKKRRQQSKEATFIKPEVLGDSIPVSGAFDLTDDDEIQKSELVVTQVQVHKEIEETSSPLPPTEQEAEMEDKTKTDESTEIAVEEISKEVNEVIKDATETVEKISENPLKDSKEELQESLVTEEKLEKIPVGETDTEKESDQPAAESATKPDSESLIDANISEKESSIPVETAVLEENIIKNASDAIPPELENTGESQLKTVLSEQVEEKPQEEVKEMDSTENVKAEVTKTESLQDDVTEKETEVPTYADTAEISSKTDGEENVQVTETEADMQMPKLETEEIKADEKPDSIEINGKKEDEIEKEKFIEKTVQIAEKEENGLASEAAQVNLLTPIGREQESRRSFTLLPDSPVAASEIDEQQDELEESALRKSSFTVLKSDESVENYDIQNDEMLVNEKSSFQIVSSPEKKSTNNQASYSSEDAAEVDDEEDEEQQNLRTGVPGAIYVSNRDGRHSAMAGSISDGGSGRKKRLKRRVKSGGKGRGWRSVEVDEESPSGQQASRDQDSGFEPSPRATKTKLNTSYNSYGSFVPKKTIYATIDGRSCSSRIEGRKPGDKNSCNMTAVTKSIHRNIRRYYMERKIFQHLLELKSLQIRSSKLNEAVLVKRAVDDYHKSCIALGAETGGSLRRYPYTEYTFKNFEMFLYETLKSLQKPGTYNFQNINEVYEEAERRLSPDYNTYEKALQCTTKTHRCLHAAHAYTGIPCAAYIPMMNHHTMPKFGFGSYKKSGVGSFYLPKILTSPVKCGTSNTKTVISGSGGAGGTRVSLELSHGKTKQLISLPSEKLDSNKRYYVTFTVKGSGEGTVTGSPGKTKIELSSDGKVIQQTDVTPIEK